MRPTNPKLRRFKFPVQAHPILDHLDSRHILPSACVTISVVLREEPVSLAAALLKLTAADWMRRSSAIIARLSSSVVYGTEMVCIARSTYDRVT